jgi:uncharacterized protein
MNRFVYVPVLLTAISAAGQDYPIRPVPFTAVRVTDRFWAPRIRKNHDVTIPIAIGHCYRTGRVDNFLAAAKVIPGPFRTEYPFDDTDLYKIIEGASYSLQTFPDPLLEARIDTLIHIISMAQEPDGYLYTSRTIDPAHPHAWAGLKRWEKDPDGSHELYNAGHLFEAAAAHYQATGRRSLLDVAIRYADLLCRDFGPGKLAYYPGHEVVEMGLVKLYRVTGRKDYLDLARYFLDVRRNGIEYNQSHLPVALQTQAVGHAVRAMYLYSGMADVAALEGVGSYTAALDAIWKDLLDGKVYVTGGIGAAAGIEGFSAAWELPNLSAYNETCASIGLAFWSLRMFLLHGDSRYIDVLERVLYNGMLSGVSLDGSRFFYPNPLESRGNHERSEWFGCACCPGNVCRMIPSVPGYAFAVSGRRLYANLYMNGSASVDLDGTTVDISEQTDYPWQGRIDLSLHPRKPFRFELAVRIPGWAREECFPGVLYRFETSSDSVWSVSVNGNPVPGRLAKGYILIDRKWKEGDLVSMNLPMPVRRVTADPRVAADTGRISLERGPLTYCVEWPDAAEGRVRDLVVDDGTALSARFRSELAGGVVTIEGRAKKFSRSDDGSVTHAETDFRAIPYYAWANRGPGEMEVWMAKTPSVLRLPSTTIASTSRISSSHPDRSLMALNDQEEPANSNDHNVIVYDFWPQKDTTQWVTYDFDKTETISRVKVYWYDDRPNGGCRVPESWSLLYLAPSGAWEPVENPGFYPVEKDKFNAVNFKPVQTHALRLELRLSRDYSGGILEWTVE